MKKKYSLILDDDFIHYCKLNNIENIEAKAKEIFMQAFNLLKYGTKPININNKEGFKVIESPQMKSIKNPEINKDNLYD